MTDASGNVTFNVVAESVGDNRRVTVQMENSGLSREMVVYVKDWIHLEVSSNQFANTAPADGETRLYFEVSLRDKNLVGIAGKTIELMGSPELDLYIAWGSSVTDGAGILKVEVSSTHVGLFQLKARYPGQEDSQDNLNFTPVL